MKRDHRSAARMGCAQCRNSRLPEQASNRSGVSTKKFSRLTRVISTSVRRRKTCSSCRTVVAPPNPAPSRTMRIFSPSMQRGRLTRTAWHRHHLPGQLPGGAVRGASDSKSRIYSGRDQNAVAIQRNGGSGSRVLHEYDRVIVILTALDNLRGNPKRLQFRAQRLNKFRQAIEAALDVNPWCRGNRQRRHSDGFLYPERDFSEP